MTANAQRGSRIGTVVRWIGAVFVLVLVFAGGAWAGQVAFLTANLEQAPPAAASTVAVISSTLGRTVDYGVVSQPQRELIAVSQISGITTGIDLHEAGPISNGQTLLWVSGVPVRAVAGATPFYRNLGSGDQGADVESLQQVLLDLGYLTSSEQVNGKFGGATVTAVRKWQEDLGLSRTGTITLGELVAVPELDGQLSLASEVKVGMPITVNQELIYQQSDPRFFIRLSAGENSGLLPGQRVWVQFDSFTWSGELAARVLGDASTDIFEVVGLAGSSLCAPDCAAVPLVEEGLGRATVELVVEVSGPAVPIAALRTQPDGGSAVELDSGEIVPVTVQAADRGMAVISGLDIGQRVVLDEQ